MKSRFLLVLWLSFISLAAARSQDAPGTAKFEVWLSGMPWALAFERRDNVIPGGTLPDLRVDDSFQKLLLQKEFRQFIYSLYGPPQ